MLSLKPSTSISKIFFVPESRYCFHFDYEDLTSKLRVVEYLLLSFGFVFLLSFLFCGFLFLSFCVHVLVISCSFSCRFLILRGWLDSEPTWKVQKRHFASTHISFLSFFCFYLFVICVFFVFFPKQLSSCNSC